MPLYFFHLRDGVDILLDEEGRDLDGPDAVARVALAEVRSIMSEDVKAGRIALDHRIDVEDTERNVVHSIEFADAVVIEPAEVS